jgi:hypothetical protein
MFIGHFAVGLAAKRAAPRASLPWLLAAPQVADILWPIFVAVGLERMHIVPGITEASPLSLDYYPYSHSLVAVIAWAALFGGVYLAFTRDRRTAFVLALCAISHWVCDWIAHTPDMPIFRGDGPRYGLGVWESATLTLLVEGGMFAIGVAIYTKMTRARDSKGALGWWTLVAFLVVSFVSALYGPPPPDERTMLVAAFGVFLLIPFAWWIDRHRETIAPR